MTGGVLISSLLDTSYFQTCLVLNRLLARISVSLTGLGYEYTGGKSHEVNLEVEG